MEISLSKLPWQAQLGAFAVLAVAGIGTFEYLIVMDKRADIDARAHQLVSLKADIEKGQATARKLPEFKSQVGELEGRERQRHHRQRHHPETRIDRCGGALTESHAEIRRLRQRPRAQSHRERVNLHVFPGSRSSRAR